MQHMVLFAFQSIVDVFLYLCVCRPGWQISDFMENDVFIL